MRNGLASLALILLAGPAMAACQQRPIGEALPAFRTALDARLAATENHLTYLGGQPEDGAIYEAQPSKAGVRLVAENGSALNEVGTDAPVSGASTDLDTSMTVAAFTVSRLSAEPEARVKDEFYADLKQHGSAGSWSHRWSGTVAVTTRTDRALVVRIFKADCD